MLNINIGKLYDHILNCSDDNINVAAKLGQPFIV